MSAQECRACHNIYPLTTAHFGPEPLAANGYRGACVRCRAEEAKRYYRANAETLREKARNRRQKRGDAFGAAGIYDAA